MNPSGEKFEISPLEQDRDFLDKVFKATDISYKEISGSLDMKPDEVYFSRRCERINDVLKRELDKVGVNSSIARYVGWDIANHEFIISNYSDKEIVIDPTWQQFLNEPNPSLPKVLIAPREEIERKLTEVGVPIDKHHIWKDAKAESIQTPPEK